MAARKGLGILGFSLDHLDVTEKAVQAYKRAIVDAEPVGAFVNDSILVAGGVAFIAEDRDRARREALAGRISYHISQVFRYHDTFPRPAGIPAWPETLPDYTDEVLDAMLDAGAAIIGDPDDALAQYRRWESAGADQILLLRGTKTKEQTLEMIRLMGEHVIPQLDTDPLHRTDRFRDAGAPAATR
jgi:alkanesulfonate monooxygenase SsuD/methylene tetrahydromethanopterin reductase-like flavin-dependent oxidoreductase (luciferase family)